MCQLTKITNVSLGKDTPSIPMGMGSISISKRKSVIILSSDHCVEYLLCVDYQGNYVRT